MKKLLFKGAATALVTPMKKDGTINLKKYKELIDFQIDNGIDAVVAVGTTGENAVLSGEEHRALMKCAVESAGKRIPVICSTGSNDTAYCINTSKAAQDCGADGLLLVTPYYNKCTQKGLIAHYEKILDSVSLPAIIYNVPSRTGFNISLDTYKILSRHPQVAGVKEASGDVSKAMSIISECGGDLPVYSGNDDLTLPLMAAGSYGVISVLSNILPKTMHDLTKLCLDGDFISARRIALQYLSLANGLFCEVSPIPIKHAMNLMGFDVGKCRLPLGEMSDENKEKLKRVLIECKLLKMTDL